MVLALGLLAGSVVATPPAAQAATPPPIKHVFVIVLENKNYDEIFGPGSSAPYLSKTLTAQGQLLRQYYGIGHLSLGNYIAMLSGQAPNPQTQSDCQYYTEFVGSPVLDPANGQAVGQGCVYPSTVKTIADQLTAKGLTWGGYMQGMPSPCSHPAINAHDDTQQAKVGAQYAARHNPFVYFHSIIDTPACAANDVPLDALPTALAKVSTTKNFNFIVPDLCETGHDAPCVDGRPGGLTSADAFLRTWVPQILASPAYRQDGMVIVTFDEAESDQNHPQTADASSCCGELPGPNSPLPGIFGPGGGRMGTVILSPWVRAGSVNDTAYNHYSLLRSLEDLFGLSHLGFAAAANLAPFGADVYNGTGPSGSQSSRTDTNAINDAAGVAGRSGSGRGLPASGSRGRWTLPTALGLAAAGLALRRRARYRTHASNSASEGMGRKG